MRDLEGNTELFEIICENIMDNVRHAIKLEHKSNQASNPNNCVQQKDKQEFLKHKKPPNLGSIRLEPTKGSRPLMEY